jgi:serine/threonine-protein kinase
VAEIARMIANRYRLIELLGESQVASVYRSRDLDTNGDVAVKLLTPELARDPDFVTLFNQAAQSAEALSHPNITAVEGFGIDAQGPYVVMEYVEGESLGSLLRQNGPAPARRAARLAADIARALAAAHEIGVIHGAIKPSNILVTREGRVKVSDFAVSNVVAGAARTISGPAPELPYYLSPEQARGAPAVMASDICSAGIVLFETLTGHRPWEGDSSSSVARARLSRPLPRPSELKSGLPADLEAIVLRAMAPDPAGRFPTAAAMADALDLYLAGTVSSGAPAPIAAVEAVLVTPVEPAPITPVEPALVTPVEPPAAPAPIAAVESVLVTPVEPPAAPAPIAPVAPPPAPIAPVAPPPAPIVAAPPPLPKPVVPPVPPVLAAAVAPIPVVSVSPPPTARGIYSPDAYASKSEAEPVLAARPGRPASDAVDRPSRRARREEVEEADSAPPSPWIWVAGVLGLLIISIVGVLLVVILTRPKEIPTVYPELVGKTFVEAERLAHDAGLNVEEIIIPNDGSGTPDNTVVEQDPELGIPMHPGQTIRLTVVVNREGLVSVPDVSGQKESDATNALTTMGLTLGIRGEAYDATVPKGSVISTNPKGGVNVASGTAVDYVVSLGPAASATPSPSPSPSPSATPSPSPSPTAAPTPTPTPVPTATPAPVPSAT